MAVRVSKAGTKVAADALNASYLAAPLRHKLGEAFPDMDLEKTGFSSAVLSVANSMGVALGATRMASSITSSGSSSQGRR